ncbi:MAG: TetR/AcrR family transcriptional regulator [Acidimicrobiia bacterium]|nr:TetR/AcrR family transcriptional regulator [Acidimicrobiia bacterium]
MPDLEQRREDAARPERRGRGRPTGSDTMATRAAIMQAARRLFAQSGYRGVSMDAVARASNVDPRTIHYHFGSKRGVFDAATEQALQRFATEVDRLVFCHRSLPARLDGYIEVFRTLYDEDPTLVALIGVLLVESLAPPDDPAGPPSNATGEHLRTLIEVVVDDGIARGEVRDGVDRNGAVELLRAIGMGLALAPLEEPSAYPALLDVLGSLVHGELFSATTD